MNKNLEFRIQNSELLEIEELDNYLEEVSARKKRVTSPPSTAFQTHLKNRLQGEFESLSPQRSSLLPIAYSLSRPFLLPIASFSLALAVFLVVVIRNRPTSPSSIIPREPTQTVQEDKELDNEFATLEKEFEELEKMYE